jgi:branched-chain amino acid transport system permease protein
MSPANLAKAILLALPLAFLCYRLIPARVLPLLRVLGGLLAGAGVSWLLLSFVPSGSLSYVVSFVTMASIYSVLSLGLNVHWGYTGLFNIGIAAFFAVGAFTSALVTTAPPAGAFAAFSQQWFGLSAPFPVGVLAAAVVAGLLAFLVGIPTLKLRTDYLAIATIGIAEVTRLIFQNERWLANGPQPLRGIPQPLKCLVTDPVCSWLPGPLQGVFGALQPRDYTFVYLVIVTFFLFGIYLLLERVVRSPWGRGLRAIREEEAAAAMNGKNVAAFRMQAFVVGAAIMGVGGALYAHYLVSIDYSQFDPLYATFIIWVMLMLGGSGNNRGAITGAFVIWGVWTGTSFAIDALRPALAAISPALPMRAPYLRFMLIALLLLFILLYRPKGLLGEEKHVSESARVP